jgi:hypothetical protein
MVILLTICIPVTALVTGFFVLKAVQLGLRWQIEVRSEQPPSMESNPVAPIVKHVQERQYQQQVKEEASMYQEWLHGEEVR